MMKYINEEFLKLVEKIYSSDISKVIYELSAMHQCL